MRYVAAYLLAVLGGNECPNSKDLKKILDSVGIETDDQRINKVISELNGKNIEEVIAQGELRTVYKHLFREWKACQYACRWCCSSLSWCQFCCPSYRGSSCCC
uniref:Large ribosomal subunit protein P2 n=1 Tax=Geotrypetes seraphini TaxID=260995 RepID=A0A6P8P4J0_GEOSA|nr:60S acidic ribosomal protein P2 isoform X2 [Geotrypetes seraphini]